MKRALHWVVDYWYVPLLAVAVFVGFWLTIRRRQAGGLDVTPMAVVQTELDAIKAKGEVREMREQLGAEQARQHVEDKYREAASKLDAEQRAKAMKLQDDPEALAKFLVKAARSR